MQPNFKLKLARPGVGPAAELPTARTTRKGGTPPDIALAPRRGANAQAALRSGFGTWASAAQLSL